MELEEGKEGGEEQTERIKLNRNLASCCKPGKGSPKSCDVGEGRSDIAESFFFRG